MENNEIKNIENNQKKSKMLLSFLIVIFPTTAFILLVRGLKDGSENLVAYFVYFVFLLCLSIFSLKHVMSDKTTTDKLATAVGSFAFILLIFSALGAFQFLKEILKF